MCSLLPRQRDLGCRRESESPVRSNLASGPSGRSHYITRLTVCRDSNHFSSQIEETLMYTFQRKKEGRKERNQEIRKGNKHNQPLHSFVHCQCVDAIGRRGLSWNLECYTSKQGTLPQGLATPKCIWGNWKTGKQPKQSYWIMVSLLLASYHQAICCNKRYVIDLIGMSAYTCMETFAEVLNDTCNVLSLKKYGVTTRTPHISCNVGRNQVWQVYGSFL